MAEYIEREALFTKVLEKKKFVFRTDDLMKDEVIFRTIYADFADFIYSIPVADVVEVVRCSECKHCDRFYPEKRKGHNPPITYYCKLGRHDAMANDFCSYGKRKGDAEE